jgi:hypothetical protein
MTASSGSQRRLKPQRCLPERHIGEVSPLCQGTLWAAIKTALARDTHLDA